MEKEKKKAGTWKSFHGVFWLVILFEFFERGSYYGVMSVLSVYLTDILHFSKTDVGTIKATIQPILYFLPIISGALADRFGYRKTLLVAFTFLGGGYLLTAGMTSYIAVFLSLCIMGLGAGTFKPIISGTIARTTDESNSSVGFGIYYWTINLGAFLVPLILVPYLKTIPSVPPWKWVLIAAAIGTGIMILPTLFFFKEPVREKKNEKEVNLIKTIANAFEIIYSPFVLIFQAMKRSTPTRLAVLFITGLLFLYGAYGFLGYHATSEKLDVLLTRVGDGTLSIKIERNMSREAPYLLDRKQIVETDGSKSILVTEDEDRPSSLTVSRWEKVLNAFGEGTHNFIALTFYKPDRFPEFGHELLSRIQKNPLFTGLSLDRFEALVEKANQRVSLALVPNKSLSVPYMISRTEDGFKIEMADITAYQSFGGPLLQELHQYPELSLLSAEALDGFVDNTRKNSFLLLFVLILFASSMVILQIESTFKRADNSGKMVFVLVTVVLFMVIIWLMPNLSTFARIVTSVVYVSLLSLYLIDYDDLPKFKDHWHFLLMIFIYSGFWILYFQMFDSVLWYVRAYVDASSLNNAVNTVFSAAGIGFRWHFDVEHVTVINAGTIILLQLFISALVKNTKALPTMIVGILFGTLGMAILAISSSIWVFMAGIIIFSVGEMTAHPKFISYVGQTAPRDRVALYMGYIFLYGVIGSSIGASIGAHLYVEFVDNLNQPRTLWILFSLIGVATVVALLLYNKFIAKKADTARPGV